jgi:hypothetical protein
MKHGKISRLTTKIIETMYDFQISGRKNDWGGRSYQTNAFQIIFEKMRKKEDMGEKKKTEAGQIK